MTAIKKIFLAANFLFMVGVQSSGAASANYVYIKQPLYYDYIPSAQQKNLEVAGVCSHENSLIQISVGKKILGSARCINQRWYRNKINLTTSGLPEGLLNLEVHDLTLGTQSMIKIFWSSLRIKESDVEFSSVGNPTTDVVPAVGKGSQLYSLNDFFTDLKLQDFFYPLNKGVLSHFVAEYEASLRPAVPVNTSNKISLWGNLGVPVTDEDLTIHKDGSISDVYGVSGKDRKEYRSHKTEVGANQMLQVAKWQRADSWLGNWTEDDFFAGRKYYTWMQRSSFVDACLNARAKSKQKDFKMNVVLYCEPELPANPTSQLSKFSNFVTSKYHFSVPTWQVDAFAYYVQDKNADSCIGDVYLFDMGQGGGAGNVGRWTATDSAHMEQCAQAVIKTKHPVVIGSYINGWGNVNKFEDQITALENSLSIVKSNKDLKKLSILFAPTDPNTGVIDPRMKNYLERRIEK